MPTTTNYGWTTPADTDLVKDGASAIRTLGTAIDTTVFNNASAAIAKTIVDAKGDIIAATAADTVARLAVGSNDQVLTCDSSTATGLKWATPASGGMTLISTTTLTGSSVTLSSIPQGYIDLRIIVRQFLPDTNNALLRLRFNADSTANRYRNLEFANGNNWNITYNSDTFEFGSGIGTSSSVAEGLCDLTIPDYTNTVTRKMIYGFVTFISSGTTTNFNHNTIQSYYNQTGAISSLVFVPSTGNFTSGTILLYGVK